MPRSLLVRSLSGLVAAASAVALLGGCMSKPASHVHYYGPDLGPAARVVAQAEDGSPALVRLATLGAGDGLGSTIFQNDVYLAYMEQVSPPLRMTNVLDTP